MSFADLKDISTDVFQNLNGFFFLFFHYFTLIFRLRQAMWDNYSLEIFSFTVFKA